MDDIAHILWSIVIYYHHNWIVAAFFGILPDILVFVPFYVMKFLNKKLQSVEDTKPKGNIAFYNKWVPKLYDVTHSIPVALVIITSCTLIFGYHIEYWAMIIHILVDIPSHERKWFGTKIFWPFSHFQFNGGSWATRDFMLANYTCIVLAYSVRLFGL